MFFLKSCTLGTQYICTVIYTSLSIYLYICMYVQRVDVSNRSQHVPTPRQLTLPDGPNMLQTSSPNNPGKDVPPGVVL